MIEYQIGVEGALLKIHDADLLERMPKGANDIAEQIVGQRPGGLHTLLLEDDRLRFGLTDPDREITIAG